MGKSAELIRSMHEQMIRLFQTVFWMTAVSAVKGEDGSRLWLRYERLEEPLVNRYQQRIQEVVIPSETVYAAVREEMLNGLTGLLGHRPAVRETLTKSGAVVLGTVDVLEKTGIPLERELLKELGEEGFVIRSVSRDGKEMIVIAAPTERGVLYGGFCFLRLLQTGQGLETLRIQERHRIGRRLLNHWDNLDGSVERGYAGRSIWKWQELPERIDGRYREYARANASIGINGTVLNNVNAQPEILTTVYLKKTEAIASVLRPYGIRVYLSVKFTAPMEIGGLSTCDPLEPAVQDWWKEKAKEIYTLIPDFGGFLVKAYSEG